MTRLEFSKVILIVFFMFCLGVTLFSCYMMFLTKDLSPLNYLIPSVFGQMASAVGFYYNKAKAENEIKLSRGCDEGGGEP